MNKLQLVDAVKLNEMFEYLKKDHENKKLLQGIKEQDEFQLEEKKDAMENAVKQNKHVGESVLSFLKQKNALKRKADNSTSKSGDGDETKQKEEEKSQETKTLAEKKVIEFLNKKGLKKSTIRLGSKNINRADLIYDLSHNASKQFMLNVSEQKVALKQLKKKYNMPANIIKNNVLRQHYTTAASSESESGSGHSGSPSGSGSGAGSASGATSDIPDIIPQKKQKVWYNDTFFEVRQKARGRKNSF